MRTLSIKYSKDESKTRSLTNRMNSQYDALINWAMSRRIRTPNPRENTIITKQTTFQEYVILPWQL